MDSLQKKIIADRRVELSKGETKKEDDDYNFDKAQLDAFANKLASMAQDSSDKAMKVEDSMFVQINEGDESLADVEIDAGEATVEQPAIDESASAAIEQSVA